MASKVDIEKRNKKVIEATFGSTPLKNHLGWNWRIPHNPKRARRNLWVERPDAWTKEELEVTRLAKNKTRQKREVSRVKTYTYWAPFNYENVEVHLGRPGTGVEFNIDGAELDIYPYGAIIIEEEEPIVAVSVIGSGCSSN